MHKIAKENSKLFERGPKKFLIFGKFSLEVYVSECTLVHNWRKNESIITFLRFIFPLVFCDERIPPKSNIGTIYRRTEIPWSYCRCWNKMNLMSFIWNVVADYLCHIFEKIYPNCVCKLIYIWKK